MPAAFPLFAQLAVAPPSKLQPAAALQSLRILLVLNPGKASAPVLPDAHRASLLNIRHFAEDAA